MSKYFRWDIDNPSQEIDCTVTLVRRKHPKHNVHSGDWQVCDVEIIDVADGVPYSKWITLTGCMVAMENEEYEGQYRVIGVLKETSYGKQYDVTYSQEIYTFNSVNDQKKFLAQILTEKQLENIVATYPKDPIKPLQDHDVQALMQVGGIGEKTARKLIDRYESCKDFGKAYVELARYGLTKRMIEKLVESYGSPDVAVDKVKSNPYVLIEDVDGIGFKKADEIALAGGYDAHGYKRCKAFVIDYFRELSMAGHSFSTYDDLLDALDEELGCDFPDDSIGQAMRELEETGKIWSKEQGDTLLVALKKYYNLERSVARHLLRLLNAPSNLQVDKEVAMANIRAQEEKQGWKFTEQQLDGVFTTMNNNVTIIRGYGGTGKTSCVTGLLACAPEEYSFKQCALSGKASVNLTDVTGAEGYTIHRLLDIDPMNGGFVHNKDNPLEGDLFILDEGSMVDIPLAEALLQAIPTGAKLIILGDTNQLESIGVGNFMLDMIDSGVVPVVTFDKVHRQGAKSAIIGESIKVAQGQLPVEYGWEGEMVLGELKDLKYIGFNVDKGERKPTKDLVVAEYKKFYQECKDISQIAVLLPTKERGTGCYGTNIEIQDYVLPPKSKRGLGMTIGEDGDYPYTIYVGDKVINLKNAKPKYDGSGEVTKNIFNGNMGEVLEVGYDFLVIDFYNIGEVMVRGKQLEQIALGYAITIHKSQGSTIPYTVFGLDYSHFSMLTRQLVYTGETRAKKKSTVIFETNALIRAIRTNNITQKDTFLYYFLTDVLPID